MKVSGYELRVKDLKNNSCGFRVEGSKSIGDEAKVSCELRV
jgi:hypothetical protein